MNYLGIEKEELRKVVENLNQLLASYHVYYQNLRNFHWNISGENFFELHRLFEELYNDAKVKIDEVAERVLTLRFKPMSHLSAYLEISHIEEAKKDFSDRDMINEILQNHSTLISQMRSILEAAEEVGDEGTIDMIAGFLADLEKRSWMLDSWRSRKFKAAAATIY